MTIISAADPNWHIRASEPEPTRRAGKSVWHYSEPAELRPDKVPGSEGPKIKTRPKGYGQPA